MEEDIKKVIKNSGTSILGIVCKDGVIMAADRQGTAGNMVLMKNEPKIVKVNDYIITSATGGVSDIKMLTKVLPAELKLKELQSSERPSIKQAANLLAMITYRNIRQFSAIPSIVGTLLAGINEDNSCELYSIEPAGSVVRVEDYDANFGSGMPFILGVLEANYKKDITVKEGIELAVQCLKASTQRDTGSGYGIDIFTLTKEGIKQVMAKEISSDLK